MKIKSAVKPELDGSFVPFALWNREFQKRADCPVALVLLYPGGVSRHETRILPNTPENRPLNLRYLERTLKFLLWQRGAETVRIAGCDELTSEIAEIYSCSGLRSFDAGFFGGKVYLKPLSISACSPENLPQPYETTVSLGRHLNGCRIGFDLGGSDRKCAAVMDGNVVFSEEIRWDPYFESNPEYHYAGVMDSLKRAAVHLPRVDAIGGSAAGIYVNNEVRVASLFRGVAPADFDSQVRRMFFRIKEAWNHVPFEVVNDGEVTALAGSMSLNDSPVLGISMGTSLAAGYVTPEGGLTPWLNELAFAPVDLRADAPADEWSGDRGCGVQYFSQQAVARLAPAAGFNFPSEMPFAEQLVQVQERMAVGDERAAKIYSTIGTCFGYALAHWADFYELRNILLLGRVTSGIGGSLLIEKAEAVLNTEFPDLGKKLRITMPDEQMKRHGQAVAAASLPDLGNQL
jgi:predicted NBD/HSP70 family sugar kinase